MKTINQMYSTVKQLEQRANTRFWIRLMSDQRSICAMNTKRFARNGFYTVNIFLDRQLVSGSNYVEAFIKRFPNANGQGNDEFVQSLQTHNFSPTGTRVIQPKDSLDSKYVQTRRPITTVVKNERRTRRRNSGVFSADQVVRYWMAEARKIIGSTVSADLLIAYITSKMDSVCTDSQPLIHFATCFQGLKRPECTPSVCLDKLQFYAPGSRINALVVELSSVYNCCMASSRDQKMEQFRSCVDGMLASSRGIGLPLAYAWILRIQKAFPTFCSAYGTIQKNLLDAFSVHVREFINRTDPMLSSSNDSLFSSFV